MSVEHAKVEGQGACEILAEPFIPAVEVDLSGNIHITVHRAKGSSEDLVINQPYDDALKARGVYSMFGPVPPEDQYSAKDTTYTAYIDSPNPHNGSTELQREVVTMRLVPANGRYGDPPSTEDIDFFAHVECPNGSRPPPTRLKEYLDGRQIPLNKIATISRLGITAASGESDARNLPEAFAAIQLAAVDDAKRMGVEFIICQLHPHLQENSLALTDGTLLDFIPAAKQLNLKAGENFVLNRWDPDVWRYMCTYPGYFFNVRYLDKVFKEELGDDYHAMYGIKEEKLKPSNAKLVSPLLTSRPDTEIVISNNIIYSAENSTGALQERVRSDVPDGVFLALMNVNEWRASAENLLQRSRELRSEKLLLMV